MRGQCSPTGSETMLPRNSCFLRGAAEFAATDWGEMEMEIEIYIQKADAGAGGVETELEKDGRRVMCVSAVW